MTPPTRAGALPGDLFTPEGAWGGATGIGVRVAVVDSGIDASHPALGDLESSVEVTVDTSTPRGTSVTAVPAGDRLGHGTACALLIRRLAPGVELHSVRVLGESGTCSGAALAAAIDWATDQRVQVINVSVSGRDREHRLRLHEAVDRAYFHNVMVVCAMNNNPVTPSYPASFASVFSVVQHAGADPFAVEFRTGGPGEIRAAGKAMPDPRRDEAGQVDAQAGNSFAAATVSGLLSLILSKHPRLTPFQLRTVLHALAREP